jgi:hypothetical protein
MLPENFPITIPSLEDQPIKVNIPHTSSPKKELLKFATSDLEYKNTMPKVLKSTKTWTNQDEEFNAEIISDLPNIPDVSIKLISISISPAFIDYQILEF